MILTKDQVCYQLEVLSKVWKDKAIHIQRKMCFDKEMEAI